MQYSYDDYGRMSEMHTFRSDAGFDASTFPSGATGDITRWHYHEATGLLTAKEYADGSQVTYAYGPAGRLATRTWARDGLTTTYVYNDNTGDLTAIDYSDDTPDIAFAYDRIGRQTQINDALGSRTFGYNSRLQLESESIAGLYNATLTRTYDNGRAAGFRLGDEYSVAYGYDAATGRFKSVDWNAAGQKDGAAYGYLANSDLIENLTTASGKVTTYAYEPLRNLKTGVENAFNTAVISTYTYAYDALGRRTSVANSGSAFAQTAFSAYGYNDRSELITSDRYLGTDLQDLSQPVTDQLRAYQYDPIGNREQMTAAGIVTGYTANTLNQYSSVSGPETYSPTYDADGNLQTAPDGMRYTYNAENRLIAAQPESLVDGATRVEFLYDWMGRRVQKTVYSYSGGAWVQNKEIQFVYDGWNLVKETTLTGDASSVDRYYVWGLDLSQSLQGAGGVGGLLAAIDGSLTYHYLFDANGNVGQVVDAADGAVAAHYEYDPFGKLVNETGDYADDNLYRFSTKYFDAEVKLYYFGYRHYTSELGRWISRDPINELGSLLLRSESDKLHVDLNSYVYVANNSISKVDPLGLIELLLVGSNVKNPPFFTNIANKMANKNTLIIQIRSVADFQNALSSNSNIEKLTYLGHAEMKMLWLSPPGFVPDNVLNVRDVSTLNTSNIDDCAEIYLLACHTAESSPEHPISLTAAFASHFHRDTHGYIGGLSFGIPMRSNPFDSTIEPFITLFPAFLRGAQTTVSGF